MLYTIADPESSTGRPLQAIPAGAPLFRRRSEVESAAGPRPKLAVAVRYDVARGALVPEGPVARSLVGPWTVAAAVDDRGVVTPLGAIPAGLVRVIGPAEVRAHPKVSPSPGRPHVLAGLLTVFRPDTPRPRRSPRRGPSRAA